MGAFFTAILAKFSAVLTWVGQLWVKVFQALWHVVTDVACWVFDGLMGIAVAAAAALDLSALTIYQGTWNQLPANVLEVLAAIGLVPAVTIIVVAIGIRITLQLIPFTRLGS